MIPQPKTLQVGSHIYRVDVGDFPDLRDGALRGETNHRLLTIRIQADRPPSQRFVSLLHEIIHCIDAVWIAGDKELSEEQVKGLAQGLAQALAGMGVEVDWEGG